MSGVILGGRLTGRWRGRWDTHAGWWYVIYHFIYCEGIINILYTCYHIFKELNLFYSVCTGNSSYIFNRKSLKLSMFAVFCVKFVNLHTALVVWSDHLYKSYFPCLRIIHQKVCMCNYYILNVNKKLL